MKEKISILLAIFIFLGGAIGFSLDGDFAWGMAGKDADWNRAFIVELSDLLEDDKIPAHVIDLMMEELLEYSLDGTPEELAEFVSAAILQIDRQLRRGVSPAVAKHELKNIIEYHGKGDQGSAAVGVRSKMKTMSKKAAPRIPPRVKTKDEQIPGNGGDDAPGQGNQQEEQVDPPQGQDDGQGMGPGQGQNDTPGKEGPGT